VSGDSVACPHFEGCLYGSSESAECLKASLVSEDLIDARHEDLTSC
jgi:hypothetical protein